MYTMKMNINKCRCATCGGPILPVFSEKTSTYWLTDKCYNHIDRFDLEFNRLVEHRFYLDTPAIFRETEMDRLPSDSIRNGVLEIMSEEKGHRESVLLHGTTGTGKTRAAWLLANNFFYASYPRTPEFMTPRKLDSWLVGSFSDSVKAHEKYVQRMCDTSLLVLDDLGKERLTPRVETDLFAIIDERITRKMPTIITTNYNGASLLERFPNKETGIALIRRFREHFRFISSANREGASK